MKPTRFENNPWITDNVIIDDVLRDGKIDLDACTKHARSPYPSAYYRLYVSDGFLHEVGDRHVAFYVVLAHKGRSVPYIVHLQNHT